MFTQAWIAMQYGTCGNTKRNKTVNDNELQTLKDNIITLIHIQTYINRDY